MASRFAQWALATCAIWVLAGIANASPIPIYNTGVDSAGVVLPNGATPDPHYTLVNVPSGSTDTLVRTGETGFPIPPWLPDNSLSRWIKPNNVGGCDTCSDTDSDPEGDYVYRTAFDLSGFDPATVVLTGRWATDDDAEIFINGTPTGIVIPFGFDAFEQWHPFTISSGFLDGINYLDFNVHNAPGGGNPSGLRVEISGRVIPEPATFVLLGAGLALLTAIRRRTT